MGVRRTVVTAAVTAACLALATWPAVSAWAASRIHLSSGELWGCRDAASVAGRRDVPAVEGDTADDPGAEAQLLYVDGRLDCILRTVLVNDSFFAVHPEQIIWTLMGPSSGAGLTAASTDSTAWAMDRQRSDLDAVFAAHGVDGLAPGARLSVSVQVTHGKGCIPEGGTFTVADTPTATVRVLGLAHTISAHGASVAYVGTAATRC